MSKPFFILSLPYLCIQNVFDFWDPFEIYHFSKISRKSKNVSKWIRKEKPEVSIFFRNDRTLSFNFSKDPLNFWNFYSIHISKILKFPWYTPECYPMFSNDVYSTLINTATHVLDVFRFSIKRVEIEVFPETTEDEMNSIMVFLNDLEGVSKIGQFFIIFYHEAERLLQLFMKTFKKNVDAFAIRGNVFQNSTVDPPNFQFDELHVEMAYNWLDLDFLTKNDCEEIFVSSLNWTAEQLNQFLQSWMDGRSNRSLKKCELWMLHSFNIKEVLKGLNAELMDPRTNVKTFQVGLPWGKIKIHGGIYLRKYDGTLVVLTHLGYEWNNSRDKEVPQKVIDEYERMMEHWNQDDVSDEDDVSDVFEQMGFTEKFEMCFLKFYVE